jgi:DNA topoisomerase-1
MDLVIVESPAKAKTLKKYLGKNFNITASYGHVKDLPKKELGVDIENGFAPKYVVIEGKNKVLKNIEKEAKQAENIYLASDPDREGEAIAWHIANYLKKNKNAFKRVLFYEITKEAVKASLANPQNLDESKFNAQQTRRILDRIVGYQVSPLLWKKVRRGLSAGRVQTVALRLICERENEIKDFVPEEYWNIISLFETKKKEKLEAKLVNKKIKNKKEAQKILDFLKEEEFSITKITKKERKRVPPPPYTTSKLQQEASSQLNFRPAKTMQIAQTLYEGVDLGNKGTLGLITYMRTDSVRTSESAIKDVRKYISGKIGKEYLPSRAVKYQSKKSNVQDAHEAIRPTNVLLEPNNIKQYLTIDQYKLYNLIWRKFVASQMKPALFDQTTVEIKDSQNKYTFKINGSVLKFKGFLKVINEKTDDKILPELKENDKLTLVELKPEQKFTEPPPRYTESSLVKALEEKGIGRPSTYAPILQNIQERKYVILKDKKLFPTDIGMVVNELLVKNFPDIFDINFTADLEKKLDEIETSKEDWRKVLKEFYSKFEKTLSKAYESMQYISQIVEDSPFTCEKCGNKMIIKWGKNGRFLACSNYPDCKNTKQFKIDDNGELKIVENETLDEKCEKCGGSLIIKYGKFGKFIACENYPECNFTKQITIMPCVEDGCDGNIIERRSKKGRVFYGCTNYPKCKFASWYEPINKMCPECGSPYLIKKITKKGEKIECPNKNCKYVDKN